MNVKSFFSKNAYQILAAMVFVVITFIGGYVTLQLFEQSITFRVSAIESQVGDIKTSLTTLNDIEVQIAAMNVKLSEIKDRQDRQSQAITDLRDSLH